MHTGQPVGTTAPNTRCEARPAQRDLHHRRHMEGPTVTTTLANHLTAADRCDRCGAQAYVRVVLSSGGELLFCAHHGRAHDARLRELAADIIDESARLSEGSSS